jgi:hypothetical protein
MYMRKKLRKRLIIVVVLLLAFVFWRGLKATTKETHDCEFKLIYALCTPNTKNVQLPGIWDILKAGVKF